jgi:hypothetical protein
MAATAWTLYDKAKKKLMNGTIQLGVNVLKLQLHTSASNASTSTLSTAASVTGQVTGANGYTTGGKSLTSVTWTVGASASQYRLDSADVVFSASGGDIANIKFAVVKNSAGQAIMWSRLSSAQFTLTQNNTLTIQINANGYFQLA